MRTSRTLVRILMTGIVATTLMGSTATLAAAAPATAARAATAQAVPLVFGHRGAAGYRPEHTLASYELAARMGADVIEPDLVTTRDGVLVVRHENEISGTTDVARHPEFTARKTTRTIDGVALTGWFTEDFTLAELKTLRAVERLPALRPRNTIYDGRYQIPTFAEVLDLRARLSAELGREIAVAPETKHPTYFQSIGKPLEPALVSILRSYRLAGRNAPVFIQSFEVANLQALNTQVNVRLVQLTGATGKPYDFVVSGDPRTYADLTTPRGLRGVSRYADVLGPDKSQVIPRDAAGFLAEPTSLVTDAHAARLQVVPYTFRNENAFLPADFRSSTDPAAYGDAFGEYAAFFATGIDGLFADNPDTALEARADFLAATSTPRR